MMNFKEVTKKFKKTLCHKSASIKDVLLNLNKSGLKICLIHDKMKLLGTVTDGDIRKALLSNKSLDENVQKIMNKKPIKIKKKASPDELMNIINFYKVDHLPITNKKGIIIDLFIKSENEKNLYNSFVIMAGGFGSRLKPYTNKLPKPLLKIKKKEMISHIIDSALKYNFKNFIVTTFYKKKLIKDFLKKKYKFNFKFTNENKPLGTAGALTLMNFPEDDFIVANCDVMTNINYSDVLHFHKNNNADATIVLKKLNTQNPYGEVEINGLEIINLYEKKITEHYVVAGIYVFSPRTLKELSKNKEADMISFIEKLKSKKYKIIAFPAHENWTEVGLMKNFKKMR